MVVDKQQPQNDWENAGRDDANAYIDAMMPDDRQ